MTIASRVNVERTNLAGKLITAALVWIAAGWMPGMAPAFAQSQRTGVSIPDSTPITNAPDSVAPAPPAKPSAAIPLPASSASAPIVYGPYIPYHSPQASASGAAAPAPFDPDANIVTQETAGSADRRALNDAAKSPSDLDAGIVTYVPSLPGEVPDGTLIKVRLHEQLSTLTTRPGTHFTAEVIAPVMRDGRVVVPMGSLLEGRVTWVRGGHRIGGRAAIHLEPESVTLPDGMQYMLHARAIDTDRWENTAVDSEGTIMRRDNAKATLTAMGLATGGAMAAGAVFGGVPGALIGAGVGAGASTVVWLRQDRQAQLPKDLGIVFSLTEPMRVTPASAELTTATPNIPGE